MKNSYKLKKCVLAGLLTAIAVLLISFIRIPIFPWASFLVLDGGDIPLLLCGFLLGPGWGIIAVVAAAVIQGLLYSNDGIIGILMHVISSGAFIFVSAFVYKKVHTYKGAWLSLGLGSLALIVVMIPFNLFVTSAYYNMPVSAVAAMLPTAIIPFNIIKGIVNSLILILIYKPLSNSLKKINWLSL